VFVRSRPVGIRGKVVAGWFAAACLVACGGAGTYNDALGRTYPPGTEAPLAGGDLLRPIAPGGPATSILPGVAPAGGGGRASAFCQDFDQLRQLVPALLVPDQQPTALNGVKALIIRLPADAPPEIRPAAASLSQSLVRVVADFGSNPPNLSDLATSFLSFQQSLSQVAQYAAAHC
jgi:hypothetical protein